MYMYSKEEILKNIDRHEIISFDIWDTLITRRVLEPEDIFICVDYRAKKDLKIICDFPDLRSRAVMENSTPNPNIYEIYQKFQELSGLDEKKCKQLLELEISIEKMCTVSRNDMVDIYRYALERKRVFLITDMYLPKKIMEDILKKNNIYGYEKLFVSCEFRQLKQENLFQIFRNEIQGNNYLHIGDNENGDYICAKKNGMDAILISRGIKQYKASEFFQKWKSYTSFSERCIKGMFIAKRYNSPFESEFKDENYTEEDIVELYIAPLVTKFICWMVDEIRKSKMDDILFATRDGYLIFLLYMLAKENIQEDMPDGKYFYTSRAACTQANIEGEEDLLWLVDVPFKGNSKELLDRRFHLESAEIKKFEKSGLQLKEFIIKEKSLFIKISKMYQDNYMKYIKGLNLKDSGIYFFYDFVSSGTCQYYLKSMLPFNINGLFFCRSIVKSFIDLPIISMITNNGVKNADSYFFAHYRYMETIMTSLEPSLLCFDKTGMPVFAEDNRSKEEKKRIKKLQNVIIEYFSEFIKLFYQEKDEIALSFVEDLFSNMEKYFETNKDALKNVYLTDDWSREKNKLVF